MAGNPLASDYSWMFNRLNVAEVTLPPLRERLEDIPSLVEHFCNAFNKSYKKSIQGLSDDVVNVFMNYRWPGNVRELEHSIEHAFVLCRESIISLDHFPAEIRECSGNVRWIHEKMSMERPEEIIEILEKTYWNKAKAARLLGIDRSTLYRKIQKYKISKPDDKV